MAEAKVKVDTTVDTQGAPENIQALAEQVAMTVAEVPIEVTVYDKEPTNFMLPDKLYTVLKWVALLLLPTCAWGYEALAQVWGWGYVNQIPFTLNVCGTIIAVLIGASTIKNMNTKG